MKITLKELAVLCNVSISTVSKSLNDSHDISKSTKERIRKIADENNYTPNILALNLKNRSTKTIGVIIPNILNYFFVHVLYGIEEASREEGYKVVTCLSNDKHRTEAENVKMLADGSVDGLLLSLANESQSLKDYEHINNAIKDNIPIVLFDRVSDDIQCDKVISDNFNGAFNATQDLIEKNCKHIALFTTHLSLNVIQERKEGCISALKDANMFNENIIFNIENLIHAEKEIRSILSQNEIDAIFTVDELLAVKTIKIARQLNIDIPDKLKIIGFGDGELSREYYPSLTTVDLHAKKIGKTAVYKLLDRINLKQEGNFMSTTVKSKLIHRESTLSNYSSDLF